MSDETLSPVHRPISQQLSQEAVEDSSRDLSNLSIEDQTRFEPSSITVDSSPECSPAWRGEEMVSITETQELLTELEPKDESNCLTDARNPSSQSSAFSDLTLQSLIQPQNSAHHSRGFVSQSVVVGQDNADSSDTLTFPQSVEKVWDNSSDKKRLSTVRAIAIFPRTPSDVAMEQRRAFHTEITEASSDSERESTLVDSDTSIPNTAMSPAMKSDTSTTTKVENPRKRRRFWQSLRERRIAIACFPKRLCKLLTPISTEPTEPIQYPIYEIKTLELEDGIVRSRVTMNSSTSRHVERVVEENGGFVVLTNTTLSHYEKRLESLLKTAFDREVGYSVLATWKSEKPEQPLEMLESVRELESLHNRVLTLADIDLTLVKRTTRSDDRENTLFRYFRSYEGLTAKMLIPS